jgi:Zn-dependent M16 (insulinase) family peptidase
MAVNPDFELVESREISEINSIVNLYRHRKTGAQILSVLNDDENKVFGITFRTPPPDSTGVPHIMEHSVLCGSRKYPAKEPFVELLKGSLKTFLNAFTMPDRTVYPVASQNLQDFYNLVDVYLDAVFFPLISEHTLQQEGWHYELEELSQPLQYKGVVFNEMKGVYSSPDGILDRASQQALYPDTIYSHDSGGDPAVIPQLTYPQFKNFHETYYHPSNAFIYFYGDDPEADRLKLLRGYLDQFSRSDVQIDLDLQPLFMQPRHAKFPYDTGGDSDGKKDYLALNWLFPQIEDTQIRLGLEILSHILLGSPASPLRKTLLESGIGEDLVGRGADDSLLQISFTTGMKGVAPENTARLEALIRQKLQELAVGGLDPGTVAASLNTIEFALRENNTGSFPRGLLIMLRSMRDWIYVGDPFTPLGFEHPLSQIKSRVEHGEPYFEGLIEEYLLKNNHCVTVVLEPDPELGERMAAAEQERLALARQAMSEAELRSVVENTQELKLRQETPDSPEVLAKIPRLTLDDLEPAIRTVPLEVLDFEGAKILYHDLFTNEILYLDLAFDLHAIPQDLLPYLPLYGRSVVEIGTETEDDIQIAQRIGQTTGGIWPGRIISAGVDSSQGTARFTLRSKATLDHVDDLLGILSDLLFHIKLDHQERFRQMALESKARKEAGLIPGGHQVVNGRLRAAFNLEDHISEKLGGISYLFFLRDLLEQIDADWNGVLQKLEKLHEILVNQQNLIVNVTLEAADWSKVAPRVNTFLHELPRKTIEDQTWSIQPLPENEGLIIPAQVNYVGKAANLYQLGYRMHGSVNVINKYLQTTWLWEKIRVQGGAYGGYSLFDQLTGVYSFVSYRDPNLLRSLENYDAAAGFLKSLDLHDDELVKSIIGVISDLDSYQLPDAKGYSSMLRYLIGMDDARRQQIRNEVLATNSGDFHAFAEILAELATSGRVVVMGPQSAIETANQAKTGWLTVHKVL